MDKKYKLTISRLTIDKLGIKLYDKVSAVIAETVANSYDADATEVEILAPMGVYLSTKTNGKLIDKGYTISVKDNGIGMIPEEVNNFYLIVGAERRADPKRGDKSKIFDRKVMGRKGVGKIAPFGVCKRIEIITSGGKLVDGIDEHGKNKKGYMTAHLILDRAEIMEDTDYPYYPEVGELDGIVRPKTGTCVNFMDFEHNRVPAIEKFERQLARRFGLRSSDWNIKLIDSSKTPGDPDHSRGVGDFIVEKLQHTEIRFEEVLGTEGKSQEPPIFRAFGPDGNGLTDLSAGFNHGDIFYPVTGWVAYSKTPYKDDLMAGIRIYCRGKIAAQTNIFNMKAGFTGEYDIRSYLIGELHADWLDEKDDLIRTDRQDILWSYELGQKFEAWGQGLVKKIGSMSREPRRKLAWEIFEEISKIHEKIKDAFPGPKQKEIRENTIEIARVIAQRTHEEDLRDPDHAASLVNLSLLFGPHITLDRKMREAAETTDDPLLVITSILETARVAELAAFGKIADDRVKVIKKIEKLKDNPDTLESAFQSLIAEAPWLINPQWSPITSNQSFSTMKKEFQKFYGERTGKKLILEEFSDPNKRADFVLSTQDNVIQIIEIKRPNHSLENDEIKRINTYLELMDEFLRQAGNEDFREIFTKFHLTLVCDKIGLTGVYKTAFNGLKDNNKLTHINWRTFLLRTRKMHEAFLNEAERQKIYKKKI